MSAALLSAGCGWEPIPPPEPPPSERVFIMYDNIGSSDFGNDVAEAGKAVANGALDPGERVIVLHRSYRVDGYEGARSVVYEVVKDASQAGFSAGNIEGVRFRRECDTLDRGDSRRRGGYPQGRSRATLRICVRLARVGLDTQIERRSLLSRRRFAPSLGRPVESAGKPADTRLSGI